MSPRYVVSLVSFVALMGATEVLRSGSGRESERHEIAAAAEPRPQASPEPSPEHSPEPGPEHSPGRADELRAPARGRGPYTVQLPPLAAEALVGIPATSARSANYTIHARLNEARHTIEGQLSLAWRNTGQTPRSRFPFHLYWNAFRDERSTMARERRSTDRSPDPRRHGSIQILSLRAALPQSTTAPPADLLPTLRYIQPDDNNADDHTLMSVETPWPIGPGESVRFEIEWHSIIPHGADPRSGWVHDYHFIAQWFPKLAGIQQDAWNEHQFHAWSEFFSDYGVYDVSLTLPQDMVVGATGRREAETLHDDGTKTLRFRQEDVHDFAWAASRRFLVHEDRFAEEGYRPVELRLLLQPEHAHLAQRYSDAARVGLRSFGAWAFPYPYRQLTIIDPAWGSGSSGMEYPTLIVGGTSRWAPAALQSPEGVTIHEVGHQFWYGLVGTNEFEQAWLDEGMTTYHTIKAATIAYGPRRWGQRYFGLGDRSRDAGWPVVASQVWLGRGTGRLAGLRAHGQTDTMARNSWEYEDRPSYRVNSYGKPALTLQTLEGLVGDETMTRILRTYARRFAYGHPSADDFIATVTEVTGQDYRWFFDETWYSSELCDYAIDVEKIDVDRTPQSGSPPDRHGAVREETAPGHITEVTIKRLGGMRLPVQLLVEFADGRAVREQWDGQGRWQRFRYTGDAVVERAVIDPDGIIALDVNPTNGAWVRDRGQARRAAAKWSARWLFWLQNLLELHAILG